MNCEECNDTGWLGDIGPGIDGNNEIDRCDCGQRPKCRQGSHTYGWYGGIPWCETCNLEADLEIARVHYI